MKNSKDSVRVLVFTRYSRLGASTRLRTLQFLPYLESADFDFTVKHLFGEDYLIRIQKELSKSKIDVLLSYLKRFWNLSQVFKYDAIWIEKELFPYFPSTFEKLLSLFGCKFIVDYDDAIFHYYDRHKRLIVRKLLGNKIDKVMSNSCIVMAGNDYLVQRAKLAGAKKIVKVPTVVDTDRYKLVTKKSHEELVIGWIGSPTTVRHLRIVEPVLQQLSENVDFRFVVIGGHIKLDPSIQVDYRNWTEESEVSEISEFDVGIMPMYDEPWTRGKCGYKLIQYMACGIPVIASPVEANKEIVDHNQNGFLANSKSEWLHFMKLLLESPVLRLKMGRAGRSKIVEEYSVKAVLPTIKKILEEVGAK